MGLGLHSKVVFDSILALLYMAHTSKRMYLAIPAYLCS